MTQGIGPYQIRRVTLRTVGSRENSDALEVLVPENLSVADMKHCLAVYLGAEIALSGNEKLAEKGVIMAMKGEEVVPAVVIVSGVSSLQTLQNKTLQWDPALVPLEKPSPASPTLTKEQARAIQVRLFERYQDLNFQNAITAIKNKHPDTESFEHRQELKRLVREVQRDVLPGFGFSGDDKGVEEMLEQMVRFMNDPEIRLNAEEINSCLGLKRVDANMHNPDQYMTKKLVLKIQHSLRDGFKDPDFQKEVAELQEQFSGREYLNALRKSALKVQVRVLPRFGFPGNQQGVLKMMTAFIPFMEDTDVMKTTIEINNLLGIKEEQERVYRPLGFQ